MTTATTTTTTTTTITGAPLYPGRLFTTVEKATEDKRSAYVDLLCDLESAANHTPSDGAAELTDKLSECTEKLLVSAATFLQAQDTLVLACSDAGRSAQAQSMAAANVDFWARLYLVPDFLSISAVTADKLRALGDTAGGSVSATD